MAARRTQAQYKELNERVEKLEAENAQLLGKQAAELSQAARDRGDAERSRESLALAQAELVVQRGHVSELTTRVSEAELQLKEANARAAAWQKSACEFADDSEALQARLQHVGEQQRSSVRNLYSELEKHIGGALQRSKSGETRQTRASCAPSLSVRCSARGGGLMQDSGTRPSEARLPDGHGGTSMSALEAIAQQPALN